MLMGTRDIPFAIEINPWTEEQALRDALFWRGTFLSAWAYVETVLLEIAMRSSIEDAYRGFRDTYPYKMSGRLQYLRRILREPGPLSAYRSRGEQLVDSFEAGAELRHKLAHGRMTMTQAEWIRFDWFNPQKGGEIVTYGWEIMGLSKLAAEASRASSVSRTAQAALAKVNSRELLKPLNELGDTAP